MAEVKRRRKAAAATGIAPSEPERDILDQYLYEVSTYPLLKGNEEIEVARKIRAGDQDALAAVSHLPIPVYSKPCWRQRAGSYWFRPSKINRWRIARAR